MYTRKFKLAFYASLTVALTCLMLAVAPVSAQESIPPAEQVEAIPAPSASIQLPPEGFRPTQKYFLGKVIEILEEGENAQTGVKQQYQRAKIRLTNGEEKGKEFEISNTYTGVQERKIRTGETVVIMKLEGFEQAEYYLADKYRLPPSILITLAFFAIVILFARWKGFRSIIGLCVTIAILIGFIMPQILDGNNPLLISMIGVLAIALTSFYISHGFNRRTSIALGSTLITLGIALILAVVFVSLSRLSGTGSEEAFFLQNAPIGAIDLKGLLLGGILIGALGVLDDITTSQVAAIEELKKANHGFDFLRLYQAGLSIGNEHIASLVNTLVLAYAGASFPLFLLFAINDTQPFWVTLNSEFMIEEIIRTLVGSAALVFAVPITTFIAAYIYSRLPISQLSKSIESSHHGHAH